MRIPLAGLKDFSIKTFESVQVSWLTAQASMGSACFPEYVLENYFMQRQVWVGGGRGKNQALGAPPLLPSEQLQFYLFCLLGFRRKTFFEEMCSMLRKKKRRIESNGLV